MTTHVLTSFRTLILQQQSSQTIDVEAIRSLIPYLKGHCIEELALIDSIHTSSKNIIDSASAAQRLEVSASALLKNIDDVLSYFKALRNAASVLKERSERASKDAKEAHERTIGSQLHITASRLDLLAHDFKDDEEKLSDIRKDLVYAIEEFDTDFERAQHTGRDSAVRTSFDHQLKSLSEKVKAITTNLKSKLQGSRELVVLALTEASRILTSALDEIAAMERELKTGAPRADVLTHHSSMLATELFGSG